MALDRALRARKMALARSHSSSGTRAGDVGVRVHDPLGFFQPGLLFGTVVQGAGLVAAIPALVFGVGEDMADGGLVKGGALQAGVSPARQLPGQGAPRIFPVA